MDLWRTPDERTLLGCLINTVPVTMHCDIPDRIGDYLDWCDRMLQESLEMARIPYSHLMAQRGRMQGSKGSSRWKTLFNFRSDYAGALHLEGIESKALPLQDDGWAAELNIVLERGAHTSVYTPIRLQVHFDTRALSKPQVVAILEA